MTQLPEGRAIVYCDGAFGTTYGKTAHGLVRRSRRYEISAIVDSHCAGRDAGDVLDGTPAGIPLVRDLNAALALRPATHLVIGLAPDGGRLSPVARSAVLQAIAAGLHVDAGLHEFLCDDPEISALAADHRVQVRDVRKPPPRSELHFFDGRIREVGSYRIALLGTDSAVGKRTTAWILTDGLCAAGRPTEMIGTGQTSWLQGSRYGLVLDSLVNDFVSGEIEHAIWRCWSERHPEVMVLEGQGSLMNPAYPGGMELLAAGRPHAVVLQHAPARTHYDGFPDEPLHSLEHQIRAIDVLSGKPVVAVTVNHEGLTPDETRRACERIQAATGVPATDVLLEGPARLIDTLLARVAEAGT